MWYQHEQGCQLCFSGKYCKLHYNTDAFILLPPNLTTYHFHTTFINVTIWLSWRTAPLPIMIWTFVLNYVKNLSHKKEENLFPYNLFCTEIWKKMHDYRLQDTTLSTKYNSILDINWLFLTQCQQPLFFCIILLELADDWEIVGWWPQYVYNSKKTESMYHIMQKHLSY